MASPKKQHWLKFYPGDWRQDIALGGCSLAARGLWIEMVSLMWQADPCGSLVHAGKPITVEKLAMQVRASVKDVKVLLEDLREAGVFSVDEDGTIFSRRIRRDIRKAENDRENGKGGGNPNLLPGVNPLLNVEDKAHGRTGARVLEARSQRLEAAAQLAHAKRAEPHDDGPEAWRAAHAACDEALGDSRLSSPAFGPIMLLVDKGITLGQITTVLRSEATSRRARGKPLIKTWATWAEIVVERLDAAPKVESKAAIPTIEIRGNAVPRVNVERIVEAWKAGGPWLDAWGDPPGKPGCLVPQNVLAEFGVGA